MTCQQISRGKEPVHLAAQPVVVTVVVLLWVIRMVRVLGMVMRVLRRACLIGQIMARKLLLLLMMVVFVFVVMTVFCATLV